MALVNGGLFALYGHEENFSLGDPFQKLSAKFLSVYKHGSGEYWLFALYGHGEIVKKKFFPETAGQILK